MNPPEKVACYLNGLIGAVTCFKNAKFYGISETVERDQKSWPVFIDNGKPVDILPDSQNKFYWKIIAGPLFTDDPEGFGEVDKQVEMSLRLFFVGMLSQFPLNCINTQLEALILAMNAIPLSVFTADTALPHGVNSITATDLDKAGILASEFPGFDLAPKILDIVAFSVTINFTSAFCSTC